MHVFVCNFLSTLNQFQVVGNWSTVHAYIYILYTYYNNVFTDTSAEYNISDICSSVASLTSSSNSRSVVPRITFRCSLFIPTPLHVGLM